MQDIKVLGTGCANCKTTIALIEQVAQAKGVAVKLEKVEELRDIMSYGVMSTPGVVIDGKVVHAGGVPSRDKIEPWLSASHLPLPVEQPAMSTALPHPPTPGASPRSGDRCAGRPCLAAGVAGYVLIERAAPPTPTMATAAEFDVVQTSLRLGKPAVVEFGANACASCREMKPISTPSSAITGSASPCCTVDILKVRGYAARYRIQLMPTQVYFDAQGREIGRTMGKVTAGRNPRPAWRGNDRRARRDGTRKPRRGTGGRPRDRRAAPCVLAAVPVAGRLRRRYGRPRRAARGRCRWPSSRDERRAARAGTARRAPGPAAGYAARTVVHRRRRRRGGRRGLAVAHRSPRRAVCSCRRTSSGGCAKSGVGGAAVLGALIGTVMSRMRDACARRRAGAGRIGRAVRHVDALGRGAACWPTGSATACCCCWRAPCRPPRRRWRAASPRTRRGSRDGARSRSSCSPPACGGSRRDST